MKMVCVTAGDFGQICTEINNKLLVSVRTTTDHVNTKQNQPLLLFTKSIASINSRVLIFADTGAGIHGIRSDFAFQFEFGEENIVMFDTLVFMLSIFHMIVPLMYVCMYVCVCVCMCACVCVCVCVCVCFVNSEIVG